MQDSGHVVVCVYMGKKAGQCPRRPSHSLARKGTSAAGAKRRRRQEDAQQRDSMLALACPSAFFGQPCKYHYGGIKVLWAWKRSGRGVVEGPLL